VYQEPGREMTGQAKEPGCKERTCDLRLTRIFGSCEQGQTRRMAVEGPLGKGLDGEAVKGMPLVMTYRCQGNPSTAALS
jgi:hypothetical protein